MVKGGKKKERFRRKSREDGACRVMTTPKGKFRHYLHGSSGNSPSSSHTFTHIAILAESEIVAAMATTDFTVCLSQVYTVEICSYI